MPFRRLVDYTGITIWVLTLVFALGCLYAQQLSNTESISEMSKYKERVNTIDRKILSLEIQDQNQKEWKVEFMLTFKELVHEMKENNDAVLKKVQSTDDNVLRTSFQLEVISNKLKSNIDDHNIN